MTTILNLPADLVTAVCPNISFEHPEILWVLVLASPAVFIWRAIS